MTKAQMDTIIERTKAFDKGAGYHFKFLHGEWGGAIKTKGGNVRFAYKPFKKDLNFEEFVNDIFKRLERGFASSLMFGTPILR